MRINSTYLGSSIATRPGARGVQEARIATQRQVKNGMAHQVIRKGIESNRAAKARYQRIAERRFKVSASTVFDTHG